MEPDAIKKALRAVDAAAGTTVHTVADLPQRVLAAVDRRRQHRLARRAAATVLLLALAAGWMWCGGRLRGSGYGTVHSYAVRSAPSLASSLARLAEIHQEGERQMRLAQRLWDAQRRIERIDQARRAIDRMEAMRDADRQHIEDAALAMVYQADRMAARPALAMAARRMYQDVVEDFPQSSLAAVARRRLSEFNP